MLGDGTEAENLRLLSLGARCRRFRRDPNAHRDREERLGRYPEPPPRPTRSDRRSILILRGHRLPGYNKYNRLLKTISNNSLVSRARDRYSYRRDKRRGTFRSTVKTFGWTTVLPASVTEPTSILARPSHQPIPAQAEAHRKWRPRDTMVQACIGIEPGKRSFYEMSPPSSPHWTRPPPSRQWQPGPQPCGGPTILT